MYTKTKHEFSHQICMQQKQIKNGELSNASTYLQIHITIIIILVYIGMYYCRMDVSILHNSTFFIGWLKNQIDLISDALPLFQNGFLTCLLYFLFWRDQTNQGKINCFIIFSQYHLKTLLVYFKMFRTKSRRQISFIYLFAVA